MNQRFPNRSSRIAGLYENDKSIISPVIVPFFSPGLSVRFTTTTTSISTDTSTETLQYFSLIHLKRVVLLRYLKSVKTL